MNYEKTGGNGMAPNTAYLVPQEKKIKSNQYEKETNIYPNNFSLNHCGFGSGSTAKKAKPNCQL